MFFGNEYEGSFENGMKHGPGRLTYNTGDVYDGQWAFDAQSIITTLSISECKSS